MLIPVSFFPDLSRYFIDLIRNIGSSLGRQMQICFCGCVLLCKFQCNICLTSGEVPQESSLTHILPTAKAFQSLGQSCLVRKGWYSDSFFMGAWYAKTWGARKKPWFCESVRMGARFTYSEGNRAATVVRGPLFPSEVK